MISFTYYKIRTQDIKPYTYLGIKNTSLIMFQGWISAKVWT